MARIKSKKYTGVYLNKLSNGDISYSISYKDLHDKKVWVTIGKKSNGITETYAYNKRAEYINRIKTGEDPLAHKKKRKITTIDMLAHSYFEDKADENKTNIRQKGKYDLHIKPLLGEADILSLSKEEIVKLQKTLKAKGRAPKTVNGIITLLRAIINHSIKEKGLKVVNPCAGIKLLKEDDKRERYLTIEEVQELIREVENSNNPALYHFVKLALLTGARLEGVLHIQKKDINLSGNSVTIHDLKSGGTYTGFFNDTYKKELTEYIKTLKVNDYIVGGKNAPVPGRTMRRWLKPILDARFNQDLDIKDTKNRVVIHTLRHTFASQLAIAGTPILTIQKLMNHADIAQTMRYAKLAPDQGINAVKSLYQ